MFRRKAEKQIVFRPFPLKEETGFLGNPYRGFYAICRLYAQSPILDEKNIPITEYQPPEGHTLTLLEINLQHFSDQMLSPEALENIRTAFRHFTSLNMAMIVRFVYDWEGHGALKEPSSLSVILQHMGQLSPLLMEYGPHIYILQGLFIGSWGEMHNTRYTSQRHLIALAEQLAACSSPHTYIAIRCPNQWRTIFRCYSPLSLGEARRNGMQSRFCLFNDAIMGSETDMGTYGSLSRSLSTSYSDKLNRYDEILFQSQLCRYVPNGGEVLHASTLNDFKPAVRTLEAMRVSYLNCNYDRAVLGKWASGHNCPHPFKKLNDLAYIGARLGYRFSLQKSEVHITQNQLSVRLNLTNQGFAPCYRPLQVHLMLTDEEGRTLVSYPVEADTRAWLPETPISFSAAFTLPENALQQKSFLSLQLFDPLLNVPVRLSNTPPLPFLTNPIGELSR